MKLKGRMTMQEKTETICRVGTGLAEVVGKQPALGSMILTIQRGFGEQLPP